MIYVDSNILMYLLEDDSERGDAVRRRFSEIGRDVVVSPLVAMECLVVPIRDGNAFLVRAYERTLAAIRSLEIAPEAYLNAARIRARHRLKTIDSIHLATAQFHLCDGFWTNDARLRVAAGGLAVETF